MAMQATGIMELNFGVLERLFFLEAVYTIGTI
jgi:hypothetical protein